MGAAYSEFAETRKGSITAGKLADLVLLSADPFETAPEALRDLRADLTVCGGRVVSSAQGSARAGPRRGAAV